MRRSKHTILVISPGGRTAHGGIGRMLNYSQENWINPEYTFRILDSYGSGRSFRKLTSFLLSIVKLIIFSPFWRVDLVHIHVAQGGSVLRKALLSMLASLLRRPIVLHLHGSQFDTHFEGLGEFRKRQVRSFFQRADRVICLGEKWANVLRTQINVSADRITILRNAVPDPITSLEHSINNNSQSAHLETRSILFLGIVSERKGLDILLRAISDIRLELAGWRVVVAGNGEIERFSALARSLDIEDVVDFRGWLDSDAARKALEEADIFALPSRGEGLPLAVLEAMALGKPIVTTPVGAIPEVIIDDENGILTNVGDPISLGAALSRLMQSSSLRAKLGMRARLDFERNFSINRYNEDLAFLYKGLVNCK